MTQQRSVIADKSFILVLALLREPLPCSRFSRYKAVLFTHRHLHTGILHTGTLRQDYVD